MRKHNKVLPGRHCCWRVAQTKTNIDKPTTTTMSKGLRGRSKEIGSRRRRRWRGQQQLQQARQGETNLTDMAWVIHDVVGVGCSRLPGHGARAEGENTARGEWVDWGLLDWVAGYTSVTTHALLKSQITTHGVASSGSRPLGQYQNPLPLSPCRAAPWLGATPKAFGQLDSLVRNCALSPRDS